MPKRQITLTFEIEEALAEKLDKAQFFENPESWIEAKLNFPRLVTRDIPQLINPIMGYNTLLADGEAGPLNETQKEYVTAISKHIERLNEFLQKVSVL